MYIAYHDVKAWKFSRCGLAGNRLVNVGNGTNINILPSITIYIIFRRQNSSTVEVRDLWEVRREFLITFL